MSDREALIREDDDQEIISESPERENETETETMTETGIETETRLERTLTLYDAVGEYSLFENRPSLV